MPLSGRWDRVQAAAKQPDIGKRIDDAMTEIKAFTESMLAIVPDTADRKIFLNEADKVYRLAIQGFFDQIAKPFEINLKDLTRDKYVVTTKRKKQIEEDHSWSIKSKNKILLFQVGFLFGAIQGKCVATPWLWRCGNRIKLNREKLEKELKDEFSTPHAGNWDPAALIAKSVEYRSTDNIEQLNKNLMSPISFALKKIVRHLERQEKPHKLRNN
ncbi:hypothetical protein A4H96_13190 [Acidithiobacillus ferrooxidans]|uniref:Uncharacterized protein n=2 Tax=Acidithiobacillus TaxID=119977 RepID=A0A179B815_ACIFR|nr:hypothetical protein A4H96_13190 [Acidithiobacillus ferrooxidans]